MVVLRPDEVLSEHESLSLTTMIMFCKREKAKVLIINQQNDKPTQEYLTMNETFYIPDLIHHLKAYIKGYHICQLYRNEKPQPRQLQHRINPSYKAMT